MGRRARTLEKSQVKGSVTMEGAGTGQNTRSGARLALSRILGEGNEGQSPNYDFFLCLLSLQ